mgnify:FL=1|tara:strand:- start:1943 stop:2368 length:426 start_codon:yes stop_codon:yes gene_type:complete
MILSNIGYLNSKIKKPLPLYPNVYAGFPSPAEDHMDLKLDLNDFLIKHPAATFYVYAKGDSMINAGIYDGDLLIVDRALKPELKSIVIAIIDGEFTVKKIKKINHTLYLIPDNNSYKPIKVTKDMNFEIWGVVTHAIHKPK